MTTIFVTHDQSEALAIADRVAVMSQGKIVALTSPAILYARPPSLFAAQFIGSPQIILWAMDGPDGDLARRVAGDAVRDGGAGLLVGVRPEHIEVGSGPLTATVTLTEQLGRDYLVHMTAGPSSIRALVPSDEAAGLAPGDEVTFHVDPVHLHLFDAESGRRVEIDAGGARRMEPLPAAQPARDRDPRASGGGAMDWRAREIGLRVGGHRGSSAAAPENTYAAFERAEGDGAAYVETDIRRTADGTLVLLHDASLDRTTDGHGPVAEASLDTVRGLDAGGWFGEAFRGQRVPDFAAFLRWIEARPSLGAALEVKAAGVGAEVARLAWSSPVRDRFAIYSFLPDEIRAAKAAAPDLPACCSCT